LARAGYNVKRAPFGWHKELELKAKGHPMAEQLYSISLCGGKQRTLLCPYCRSPIENEDLLRHCSGESALENKSS
jgi:threonyl-tRNA synthetase